jgi:hypothetical protein
MTDHICDESCIEPDSDGGFPDCPVLQIQYDLWHYRSEVELLERKLNDLLDPVEE